MKISVNRLALFLTGCLSASGFAAAPGYTLVDTGQSNGYDNAGAIALPRPGQPFYGQDANYKGAQPAYRANGDGTATDLNTGLMWQQDPGAKMTYEQAVAGAGRCRLAGHADWRLPTIKELYSLIQFNGADPVPGNRGDSEPRPFIDSTVFHFQYGREEEGDRIIDSQYASGTRYVSTTMGRNETMFGVNFADGRIKGYPIGKMGPRGEKKYYVLFVRGNPDYGKNKFKDNGDGTVTDHATGDGRGRAAVYVAFGRAMGCMHGRWMDVHGAGAQRSDSKEGDPAGYPEGRGPQGDAVRILNYVRCVRGGVKP